MKQKNIYSKYACDDKLKIYAEAPLNKAQYQKMIENAKPRYMDNYYNAPRYRRKKDEKAFNNLLDNYYTDYNKIKNKYNFDEYEQNQETLPEEQNNNNFDYDQFQIKKRNLYSLFLSYDIPDINEINFDLTDNLINKMYDGKNDTLLKNTQTKEDYNFRLNSSINQFKKNDNKTEKERKVPSNHEEETSQIDSKIEDEILYLDDENQENYDDNYLKLKYNDNKNSEEFPLLRDIIDSKYNKKFVAPTYEIPNTIEFKKYKKKNKIKRNK